VSLATAMETMILDRALRGRMGERGREIAEQKYDVHKVNEVLMKTMGLLR
ncbi:MAG: glycosyltransferase family 1 protein, partial [Gammaproteobacteria bacterium]|nr:glycosyltransferase family 1 protein [Gammaproteobacteria bacterium]